MTFQLTAKQKAQVELASTDATHIMAYGGSRSGKTFGFVRAVLLRALAHRSRHAVLRYRFNHIKASVILDTLPKVMELCFPGVDANCKLDKTDWYYSLPNGSEIWFGGLDDKERTEKILGQEYATLYLNECSQIPYASRNMAITRLAQKTPLRLKAYYDCVSGDTVLDGQTRPISELAAEGKPITVMTTHGERQASAPWMSGIARVYLIKTSGGRSLRVTSSHQFWTPEGWRQLSEISIGRRILCTDPHQSRGGDRDVRAPIGIPQGSPESCYKYPRQRGGRSHSIAADGQVCHAFSSGGAGHSLYPSRRGGLDNHTDHHEAREALHIRRNLAFRGPPSRAPSLSSGRIEGRDGSQAFGSFPQTHQSALRSDLAEFPVSRVTEASPASRVAVSQSLYSEAVADDAAIYRQWQRYNRFAGQSLGLSALGSIEPDVDLLAHDTPLMDGCVFEMVVGIEFSATIASYTVEVPFTNHYVANGIVSHNCNPPGMAHWTYKLFVEKKDPDRRTPLANPTNYAAITMNPKDNEANLPASYLEELQGMSEAMRRRFWLGQFADMSDSALWTMELLDQQRIVDGKIPEMVRIVVAVDPSGVAGEEDKRSDEVGIAVCGLGKDGRGYVLEDISGRMAPAQWGDAAVSAFDRWEADCVVAESNFGGAMVAEIIRSAASKRIGAMVPYREVTASRGKIVRAEPIAALFEQQKVSLVGYFGELEDQLCAMTTAGYVGSRSPDRADAMIWGLASLFPAMTKREDSSIRRAPVVRLGHANLKKRRA